jgi:hypothetical protein
MKLPCATLTMTCRCNMLNPSRGLPILSFCGKTKKTQNQTEEFSL